MESEEEKIVVTRQEEERDPEAEAEFDRELAKLTAESLDSRKFDRKPMFDVPLPIKKNERSGNPTVLAKEAQPTTLSTLPDTMAFRLLTKRGNRQQVRACVRPATEEGIPMSSSRFDGLTSSLDTHRRDAGRFHLRPRPEDTTASRT